MKFDERARRATQGIHRAVEVMEMSDTKTPHKITRFDQYRARMSRNQRIVAIAVGVALPLLLLVGAVRLLASDPDPKVPLAPPSASVSPTPVSGRTRAFEAPFTYTLPPGWTVSDGSWAVSLGPPQIWVFSSFVPARSDCSDRPKQGVGRSSDAMTSWLSTYPALDATTPREVTLGGRRGVGRTSSSPTTGTTRARAGPFGRPQARYGSSRLGREWSIDQSAKLRF